MTRFFVTRSIAQNTTAIANTQPTRRFGSSGFAGTSGFSGASAAGSGTTSAAVSVSGSPALGSVLTGPLSTAGQGVSAAVSGGGAGATANAAANSTPDAPRAPACGGRNTTRDQREHHRHGQHEPAALVRRQQQEPERRQQRAAHVAGDPELPGPDQVEQREGEPAHPASRATNRPVRGGVPARRRSASTRSPRRARRRRARPASRASPGRHGVPSRRRLVELPAAPVPPTRRCSPDASWAIGSRCMFTSWPSAGVRSADQL